MSDIVVLKAIDENLEYNLGLFDKVGNLGMHKAATLVEAKSDVVRSIRKVNGLITQLKEEKDGV